MTRIDGQTLGYPKVKTESAQSESKTDKEEKGSASNNIASSDSQTK